jgi:hypothetical protein
MAKQDENLLGPYDLGENDADEKPQSLIAHLVSSLTSGQDLTRVLIPTFFLEPRSLLEKYTDLWVHPQLLLGVASLEDPVQRMISVLRWYVSGWHVRPKLCKKPYNPILGEEFFSYWDHGDSRSDFYSEQVSHHPPVSAIYIENRKQNITINAQIYAKSKFLGNSAACLSVGEAYVNLNNLNEEYEISIPTYYACGLFLGTLRMELGDKKTIVCKKTGITAEIDFKTKPFMGGEYNKLKGKIIMKGKDGKDLVLHTFEGGWDKVIKIKDAKGKEEILFDVDKTPVQKKFVTPIDQQGPWESRRAWDEVSKALKKHDHVNAEKAKTVIEDLQRKYVIERTAKKIEYQTKLFHKNAKGVFVFDHNDTKPYDPKEAEKPLPTDYNKRKAAAAADKKISPQAQAQPAAAAAEHKEKDGNAPNGKSAAVLDLLDGKASTVNGTVNGSAKAAPTKQDAGLEDLSALADSFASAKAS